MHRETHKNALMHTIKELKKNKTDMAVSLYIPMTMIDSCSTMAILKFINVSSSNFQVSNPTLSEQTFHSLNSGKMLFLQNRYYH